jgi:hypothetical protein
MTTSFVPFDGHATPRPGLGTICNVYYLRQVIGVLHGEMLPDVGTVRCPGTVNQSLQVPVKCIKIRLCSLTRGTYYRAAQQTKHKCPDRPELSRLGTGRNLTIRLCRSGLKIDLCF